MKHSFINKVVMAGIGMSLTLSACNNEFDFEKAHIMQMEEVKEAYAEHFKEIFGEVSPTQSWDLTQVSYGTRAGSGFTVSGGYSGEDWYNVLPETRSWLDNNLKETENHQSIGNPFVINVPSDGTFDLIPIYQGFSSSFWDMHMVVQPVSGDPVDVMFWEKNDNIEVQLNPLLTRPNGNYSYLGDHVVKISSKQNGKYMDCNGISPTQSSRYLITSINGKKVLYSFGGTSGDVKSINYTIMGSFQYYVMGYTPSFDYNKGLVSKYPGSWYQYYAGTGFNLTANSYYILEAEIQSNQDYEIPVDIRWKWAGNGEDDNNCRIRSNLTGKGSNKYQKVKIRFQARVGGNHDVIFQPGNFQGTFYVKSLRIYKDGGEGFMVAHDGGVYADLDPNNASEFISYDDYFTLGNYFLYNDGSSLKVYKNTSNKSWDMPDGMRDNRYKWNFERVSASETEKATITNLRNIYGVTESTLPWVNVQVTDSEESTSLTTRAKKYTFSGLPAGAVVYFYWETKMPYWRLGTAEAFLSSLKDQMRAFDCPRPSNIPNDKIVKVIGCEAALAVAPENNPSAGLGDRDYNDMVFLLVMNEEPKYVPISEEHEIVVEKRYMVEDLGATDDIDFNDMVVDIRQISKEKWTIENGKITNKVPIPNSTSQEVILRAMGGTLDFDFKIGDNVIFTKSKLSGISYQTMYKTGVKNGKSTLLDDYNGELYKKTLTGTPWNPSSNNVSFIVYKNGMSTANGGEGSPTNSESNQDATISYAITFPTAGDPAPHIIAFPVTKLWRDERHECCKDWLEDKEPALWEMPENDPDATNNTHTESFSTWIQTMGRDTYLSWVETNFSTKVKNSIASWLNSH